MSTEEGDVVICRACIKESMEYKSIYRQGVVLGEITTLAAMLSYCTNLEFLEHEDFLPSNICLACMQHLVKLYAFKQTVLKANETLRNQHSELIADGQELHQWKESAKSEELLQKQGLDHSYVTLTVVEDSKLGTSGMNMRSEELDEDENTKECVQPFDDQQGNELLDDCDHDQIFQVEVEGEHLEMEEELKVEVEEYESDTYVVTLQDSQQSLTASVSASEIEEDIPREQNGKPLLKKVEVVSGLPSTMVLTDGIKQEREVKPRMKSFMPKVTNPALQCQVCGKQLSNHNSYRYHMQLHSDATPFLCSLCGEGFKTRNAYDGHMSLHDPNNPNTCEVCGKSYRQPSSLRAHMLTHTGEKPFQCDICGKGMTQKSGYKKHMLTHTGEKPHTCDFCGRAFRYSSNLISHKRHHTGEKPYGCPVCEKSFSTTEQLKRHTLVHTGEKPFSCEVCNKRFNRRSSLVAHSHTHESTRANDRKSNKETNDAELVKGQLQVKFVEQY